MVSNILPANPTPLPGVKNLNFTEHGHAAYQSKMNHKCHNLVANYLPADHPPYPGGQKVKIQLFQNMVMLHINLKGITFAA